MAAVVESLRGRAVRYAKDTLAGEADVFNRLLSDLVGSGSSPDRWGFDMDYRVRLCPPGPMAFACVWPEREIPPSHLEVDGTAVLRAAENRGAPVGR